MQKCLHVCEVRLFVYKQLFLHDYFPCRDKGTFLNLKLIFSSVLGLFCVCGNNQIVTRKLIQSCHHCLHLVFWQRSNNEKFTSQQIIHLTIAVTAYSIICRNSYKLLLDVVCLHQKSSKREPERAFFDSSIIENLQVFTGVEFYPVRICK